MILFVEDEREIAHLIQIILDFSGYESIHAKSGKDAISILRSAPVDLILMDAMMADLDGIQTVKHIKSDPALADIPIILISGLPQTSLAHLGLPILSKPFDVDTLTSLIQHHLYQ